MIEEDVGEGIGDFRVFVAVIGEASTDTGAPSPDARR
jgi:hypothetical protein